MGVTMGSGKGGSYTNEKASPELWPRLARCLQGLDCGPQSIAKNAEAIAKSKTIMWNGPKDMMNKILLVTSTVDITVIGGRGTVTASAR